MMIKIIPPNAFIRSQWSGGTTQQLYIFPEDSDFLKKDFSFRISTATVETESSVFTNFAGYSRKLLILDGKLEINHKNHYSKTINKFEIDEFDGSWETTAFGKVNDFNVIYKSPFTCDLMPATSDQDIEFSLEILPNEMMFIYVLNGELELATSSEKLVPGSLCLARSDFDGQNIHFKSITYAEWVLVKIRQ